MENIGAKLHKFTKYCIEEVTEIEMDDIRKITS